MKFSLPHLGFPLLTKDLLEQAQNRRTYQLRSSEALLLYLFVLLVSYDNFARANWNFFEVLGVGREMLEVVFTVTAWGIYLIMPVMTCGAIAGERERETWQLLLVTRLGKRTILLEKYFSRVISALTFLVLTIPVMVVAYPLGGITAFQVIVAVWSLFLCLLLVGATGLCCSAWCKSISGALVTTYLLLAAWLFCPIFVVSQIVGWNNYRATPIHWFYSTLFSGMQELANIPWILFWEVGRGGTSWVSMAGLGYYSIPTLVQVMFFLGLAFWGISRPIATGGASFRQKVSTWLDRFFQSLNQNSITRGKKFFKNRSDFPESHPIAWLEQSRVLLGSPTQRIRAAVAIMSILVLTIAYSVRENSIGPLMLVMLFLFMPLNLFFSIASASLISRERSRQTLDVLLVTPISGSEILREKMAGLNRWYWSMIIAYASVLAFGVFLAVISQIGLIAVIDQILKEVEWILEALMIFIYLPPLVIWISVACGIVSKSRSRAVLRSLGIVGGWCFLGWMVAISESLTDPPFSSAPWFMIACAGTLSGPLFIVTSIEARELQKVLNLTEYLCFSLGNAVFYLVLSRVIRHWCYRNFARKLGRLEFEESLTEPAEVAA